MAGKGDCGGEHVRGPTYAALDLGTNNCRLLVARPTPDGFKVIDAFSRIVRLGEGLAKTGRLNEAAVRRTVDALRVCARKMRRRSVLRARNVATEACRRAENCDAFLTRVRNETGIDLEIISTNEEARLALAGCLPLLEGAERYGFVFDIGGGSTELIWIELDKVNGDARNGIQGTLSLPVGVVNLAERYGGDRIGRDVYEEMVVDVADRLSDFEGSHDIARRVAAGQVQMLGTSGTVTTLASVNQGLARYERNLIDGAYLGREEAAAINARLADMNYDERAGVPCIGPERADLVVAGAAILDAIWRTWPVPRLRVADRGLREGILLSLMAKARPCGAAALN
ncbi:MAG: Ppx/GppA family phosphatase [Alphaproteobacteria bacterium]|nr:Ppx/GppA family phosphatase [Alphaproteobacteria bacterium]